MVSRRHFLATAAATLAAPYLCKGATQPIFKVGLAADAQYADVDSKGTRHYRASIGKLSTAVEHFNAQPLAFCVHLGDLIDRQWGSFEQISKPLSASRHRFHHVLGNHDFDVLDSQKPGVPGQVGLKQRYHGFDLNGFRFVFLDTTDVSTYAHSQGTPELALGMAELERLQALKLPQAKPWNSGIGKAQLQWLDGQCTEAATKNLRVIAFAHHPVAPAGGHDLWNSEEVLQLISRHRHIAAWINGHNHAGAYAEVEGAHYLTVHGMVETAETNAYATIDLHADRLIITGHDREPSRELIFRA